MGFSNYTLARRKKSGIRMTDNFSIGVDDWVDYLSDDQLPVLANSVQSMTDLTSSEDSRVSALYRSGAQGSHLTSRLLQIASSASYRSASWSGDYSAGDNHLVGIHFCQISPFSMKVLRHHARAQPHNTAVGPPQRSKLPRGHAGKLDGEDFRRTDREGSLSFPPVLKHAAEMAFLSKEDDRASSIILSTSRRVPHEAAQEVLGCRLMMSPCVFTKQA